MSRKKTDHTWPESEGFRTAHAVRVFPTDGSPAKVISGPPMMGVARTEDEARMTTIYHWLSILDSHNIPWRKDQWEENK